MNINDNKPGNEDFNQDDFKSDAAKLSDKHMADENHKITEEDLRNIKVGQTPGPDAPTEEAIEEAEDRIPDRKALDDNDDLPGEQKVTPWDTIDQ